MDAARAENSEHTAEEERGALADFRRNAPAELREEIGAAWLAWHGEHPDGFDRDRKDLGGGLTHLPRYRGGPP